MSQQISINAKALSAEMDWLAKVIDTKMAQRLRDRTADFRDVRAIPMPYVAGDQSTLTILIHHYNFGFEERIILALALAPHVLPHVLDPLLTKDKVRNRNITEIGGKAGKYHNGFLPTVETVSFLTSNWLEERISLIQYFKPNHPFQLANIISLELHQGNEPLFSSQLVISEEALSLLISGEAYKPDFSMNFPAKRLNTRLSWDDLVLEPYVREEINEISAWIDHQATIMDTWGLKKQLKKGYRALFYGPPGTGKTLTACLIGQQMNMDVYRVDLSQVVSKYIGETEKNIGKIFDLAENKNWILFFDEADALFGKRTGASDSKDRHANQEVAYLLQRVEDFAGVVILATNLKANMDIAFTRRFQSIIPFPAPTTSQRVLLWQSSFKNLPLKKDVDFEWLADEYKLTGGSIINVLRFAALTTLRRKDDSIGMQDILEGIKRELQKAGKLFN